MDLNQLVEFMYLKRCEFERIVCDEAKKLTFQDVIKDIKVDTAYSSRQDFQEGQPLEFLLCQGHYTVIVDREGLILRGNYGIEVARFKGKEVEKFYDSLSTEILKANQEELDNLPF